MDFERPGWRSPRWLGCHLFVLPEFKWMKKVINGNSMKIVARSILPNLALVDIGMTSFQSIESNLVWNRRPAPAPNHLPVIIRSTSWDSRWLQTWRQFHFLFFPAVGNISAFLGDQERQSACESWACAWFGASWKVRDWKEPVVVNGLKLRQVYKQD